MGVKVLKLKIISLPILLIGGKLLIPGTHNTVLYIAYSMTRSIWIVFCLLSKKTPKVFNFIYLANLPYTVT